MASERQQPLHHFLGQLPQSSQLLISHTVVDLDFTSCAIQLLFVCSLDTAGNVAAFSKSVFSVRLV